MLPRGVVVLLWPGPPSPSSWLITLGVRRVGGAGLLLLTWLQLRLSKVPRPLTPSCAPRA